LRNDENTKQAKKKEEIELKRDIEEESRLNGFNIHLVK
jgi:hypothetical protein